MNVKLLKIVRKRFEIVQITPRIRPCYPPSKLPLPYYRVIDKRGQYGRMYFETYYKAHKHIIWSIRKIWGTREKREKVWYKNK